MFDVCVEVLGRIRIMRRRQNTAIPECARAELHSPVHPGDDFVFAELRHRGIDQLAGSLQIAKPELAIFEYLLDLFGRIAGSQKEVVEWNPARLMVDLMPPFESSAQSGTGIS